MDQHGTFKIQNNFKATNLFFHTAVAILVFAFSWKLKAKKKNEKKHIFLWSPNLCWICMFAYSSEEPAASVEEVLTFSSTTIHPGSAARAASGSSCDSSSDPCESPGGWRLWLSSGRFAVLMSVTGCGDSLSHPSSSHVWSSRVVKSTVIPGGLLPVCAESGSPSTELCEASFGLSCSLGAAASEGSSVSAAACVASPWWWWPAQRLGGLSADSTAPGSVTQITQVNCFNLETLQQFCSILLCVVQNFKQMQSC